MHKVARILNTLLALAEPEADVLPLCGSGFDAVRERVALALALALALLLPPVLDRRQWGLEA